MRISAGQKFRIKNDFSRDIWNLDCTLKSTSAELEMTLEKFLLEQRGKSLSQHKALEVRI